MPRRRHWTIAAVLLALAPVFFSNDGVLFQITSVEMPWRLVIVLVPGVVAAAAALANEFQRMRHR